MTRKWYVVRTRPRSESAVARQLEREGLETFSPFVMVPHFKNPVAPEPLFPGYLFLRLDLDESGIESIGARSGIIGWVHFGDSIPSVPNDVIFGLKRRDLEINGSGGLWTRFGIGDQVRVIAGRLDCQGVVTRQTRSPQERVQVLLDFIGGTILAKVPWSSLQLSNPDRKPKDRRKIPRRTRGKGRLIRRTSLQTVEAIRT